jgi:hypothetical protein
MAVSQLNSTTLNAALAAAEPEFTVAATTNVTVGSLLVIASKRGFEIVKVQEIPASGRVRGMRGWAGTQSRPAPNGALVYIGTPDLFKAVRDNAAALVGDSGNLPDYCIPGTKARDGAGNEYVLCDFTASVYSGSCVLISNDGLYTAAPFVAGAQGSVGVCAEEGTSNQLGWVQIYGATTALDAGGTSAADSTYLPGAATSVSTPATGLAVSVGTSGATQSVIIKGMFITGAATTATTSATSHTGVQVPVWLNYPYVEFLGIVPTS